MRLCVVVLVVLSGLVLNVKGECQFQQALTCIQEATTEMTEIKQDDCSKANGVLDKFDTCLSYMEDCPGADTDQAKKGLADSRKQIKDVCGTGSASQFGISVTLALLISLFYALF